jgi:hypothetical protein
MEVTNIVEYKKVLTICESWYKRAPSPPSVSRVVEPKSPELWTDASGELGICKCCFRTRAVLLLRGPCDTRCGGID